MSTAVVVNPSRFDYDVTALPWGALVWASSPNSGLPANGQPIGSWTDIGTRALNPTSSGTARPIMSTAVAALNNKPAAVFDGVNDWMVSAAGTGIAVPYTMVWIGNIKSLPGTGGIECIMPIGTTSAQRGIGINGAATPSFRFEAGANNSGIGTATTGAHLIIGLVNGTSTALEVDGTSVAAGLASQTVAFNTLGLGARNSVEPSDIDVALAGMIPRQMTTQEKAALRSWSQSYYTTL